MFENISHTIKRILIHEEMCITSSPPPPPPHTHTNTYTAIHNTPHTHFLKKAQKK